MELMKFSFTPRARKQETVWTLDNFESFRKATVRKYHPDFLPPGDVAARARQLGASTQAIAVLNAWFDICKSAGAIVPPPGTDPLYVMRWSEASGKTFIQDGHISVEDRTPHEILDAVRHFYATGEVLPGKPRDPEMQAFEQYARMLSEHYGIAIPQGPFPVSINLSIEALKSLDEALYRATREVNGFDPKRSPVRVVFVSRLWRCAASRKADGALELTLPDHVRNEEVYDALKNASYF